MEPRFVKTARNFPGELEAFRVWIVTPLARPNEFGMTHDARWHATRGEDTEWEFRTRKSWERTTPRVTAEDAAMFEALPLMTDADVEALCLAPIA